MSASGANPSPPVDLAKLDELEAVTREYSLYSRSAFGLGHLPGLAVLVLGLALNRAGILPWGIVITAVAPWVWLATREPIRKRLYQREGYVTERAAEMDRVRPRIALFLTTLIVVGEAAQLHFAHQGTLWRAEALPIAAATISALAFAAVAWFRLRSGSDAALWYAIGYCVVFVAEPSFARELQRTLLLLIAISSLWVGINQHFKYRRLERRLTRLRATL